VAVIHSLVELSPSLEAAICAATQELPSNLWNPKVQYLVHKSPLFSMAFTAHSGHMPFIQFRNHFSRTVGLLGLEVRPSQGRYLQTGQHRDRINAYTHQTSMPWVGLEPTISASEQAKTVHALDRAATVTGSQEPSTGPYPEPRGCF
jgi:hypothetical protein